MVNPTWALGDLTTSPLLLGNWHLPTRHAMSFPFSKLHLHFLNPTWALGDLTTSPLLLGNWHLPTRHAMSFPFSKLHLHFLNPTWALGDLTTSPLLLGNWHLPTRHAMSFPFSKLHLHFLNPTWALGDLTTSPLLLGNWHLPTRHAMSFPFSKLHLRFQATPLRASRHRCCGSPHRPSHLALSRTTYPNPSSSQRQRKGMLNLQSSSLVVSASRAAILSDRLARDLQRCLYVHLNHVLGTWALQTRKRKHCRRMSSGTSFSLTLAAETSTRRTTPPCSNIGCPNAISKSRRTANNCTRNLRIRAL